MITISNYLNGSWDDIKGNLQTDLHKLVSATNQRWAATLGDKNQLDLSTAVRNRVLPPNGGVGGLTVLQDAATLFVNPALGTLFYVEAQGNRTLTIQGSTPSPGQLLTIAHKAAGGSNRTLTLTTGSGQFRFGTTIASLSATTSTKTDYITSVFNAQSKTFDVHIYSQGY